MSCSPSCPKADTPYPFPLEADTSVPRRDSLRVVVLGPGDRQPRDLDKRRQVVSRLRSNGYLGTLLGEDFLGNPENALHMALRAALPDADLLLVLNTGPAPLVELTTISFNEEALHKTRVWSRREYTEGPRSTPSDVVKMFHHRPFTEEEFNTCTLTGEMVEAVDEYLIQAQMKAAFGGSGVLPPGIR